MVSDLPKAYGEPPVDGRIRCVAEDFRVEEVLGFEPDGSGNHAFLRVEKTGANSGWVAGQLGRSLSVARRDVGFAGQKDRNAVTVQWFSVPLAATAPLEPLAALSGPDYRVLAVIRHGRKLRPGSHRSNRFRIRVRDVDGDPARLEERLQLVKSGGVPNYFGPQRFGRQMSNLQSARKWAKTGRAPDQRSGRSFALSAARSWLFNRVLADRVRNGNWRTILPGEAIVLDGSSSFFKGPELEPDSDLVERCARMDVHPSGPLWGNGDSPVGSAALQAEISAAGEEADLRSLLESQGLKQERRSLRLPAGSLEWRFDGDALLLDFELPRGAFATAVLHEIVQGAWDD